MALEFEDLDVWKLAEEISLIIYKDISHCRDFSYKDQLQRACISIMNNIAEGYERNNPKEFRYFLRVSKGSSGEVRSMLHFGLSVGYITQPTYDLACGKLRILSRMLYAFINKISENISTA
ncbi:MAG: four helix bundle protein [Patescibacteria group bacterium]|nr:four helix bundle protein [Patescibacteria group bacterium]